MFLPGTEASKSTAAHAPHRSLHSGWHDPFPKQNFCFPLPARPNPMPLPFYVFLRSVVLLSCHFPPPILLLVLPSHHFPHPILLLVLPSRHFPHSISWPSAPSPSSYPVRGLSVLLLHLPYPVHFLHPMHPMTLPSCSSESARLSPLLFGHIPLSGHRPVALHRPMLGKR